MRKEEPSVAIIILNHNGAVYVERCLNSIFRNHYSNFEVVFIDNNSSDDYVERALSLFKSNPHFTIIRVLKILAFQLAIILGLNEQKQNTL